MQSLTRAIKRGNAVMFLNSVTKVMEAVWKRGTNRQYWYYALRMSDRNYIPPKPERNTEMTLQTKTKWYTKLLRWIKNLFK